MFASLIDVKQLSAKEMVVSGEEALKIAEAINSTTMRMLQVLGSERLDVTTISKRLKEKSYSKLYEYCELERLQHS